MRWHCPECGCEFNHSLSMTNEIIICPQCGCTDVSPSDSATD